MVPGRPVDLRGRTAYRIERDAFIAEVAAKLGFRGKAATFEPDTGDVSAFEVTA